MRWRRVVAARDQTAGHLLRQVIAPAACLYERGYMIHELTVAINHHRRHRRKGKGQEAMSKPSAAEQSTEPGSACWYQLQPRTFLQSSAGKHCREGGC